MKAALSMSRLEVSGRKCREATLRTLLVSPILRFGSSNSVGRFRHRAGLRLKSSSEFLSGKTSGSSRVHLVVNRH